MNKIVVYTCIIDNYDILKEVKNPEKNIDYIYRWKNMGIRKN